jgi:hypothetical protein
LFNVNKTIQCVYRQYTADYMPISYSIDVDFNITILDFIGAANISGTSNYIKAWNKANREGTNNNSWGGASDNNKDNNNGEDVSGVKI